MELEEALKKITELEGKVETLTKENTDYKAGADEFKKQLGDKEAEIAKLNDQARERGTQFKKLRDMTAEQKELLTEQEKEILQRQEAQEEAFAKFQEEQKLFKETQRNALIDTLANKKAGGNKELADKIKVTLSKIKDIDLKATEQELMPEIDFAFNGLGIQTKPDPLVEANNWGGNTDTKPSGVDYSDTDEGKALAGMLNLSQVQPDNNK